ncbi:hypothetical protein DN752_02820 [Echinicola strongylocentroti]|uniref:Uncharacterized protein n=1 Tax=Echinicola strongylocentroti TaxID=1795355 RepID=A0A2Z4IFA1_9BACT|nr:hypothetical protein [Echinicola strongylocentroti]AWW29158.1 hypothetical protein DN752_02815 [Echinicola strongylocentroti]AWW29159.1 hypothetical protein DN752_02820 [Echinicola strongylocentroti]
MKKEIEGGGKKRGFESRFVDLRGSIEGSRKEGEIGKKKVTLTVVVCAKNLGWIKCPKGETDNGNKTNAL